MATSDTYEIDSAPVEAAQPRRRRWLPSLSARTPHPDTVARWQHEVEVARERGPLKQNRVLYDEWSWLEVLLKKRQARWQRSRLRGLDKARLRAGLAAERRKRRNQAAIQRSIDSDRRWRLRADAQRERLTNFDSRLATLVRTATWSSRALIIAMIFGMVWAGVNVQQNLVPDGDMSNPLYWFSYFVEMLVSVTLFVFMKFASTAAAWGKTVPHRIIFRTECILLSVTWFLNAGPHAWKHDWLKAVEFSVVPLMIGVILWSHGRLTAWYADLLTSVTADMPVQRPAELVAAEPDPVPSTVEFGAPLGEEAALQDWTQIAEAVRTAVTTKCTTEQIQTILVYHYVRKVPHLRQIAREAGGLHHMTVKRILEASEPLVTTPAHTS
ncbi:hypothetical protein [Nocardia sp. IFM 10818]